MDVNALESDYSSDEGSMGAASAGSKGEAAAQGMSAQPAEFYDPEADGRDEAWMQKMRKAQKSDALLSCPLCFTSVCIDCQQHEQYENQFRAMFVMNCKVKTGQVVTLPTQSKRSQKKQQRRQQQLERQRGGAEQQPAPPGAPGGEQQQQQAGAANPATGGEQQQQGPASMAATGMPPASTPPADSKLNPVCCAVCDTELGLRDAGDGLYHFFNVFASNA